MANPFEQHGMFSWNELMTTDAEGAKAFYQALFGWDMATQPVNNVMYTVLKAAGQEVGGLMQRPPGMENVPSHWATYVTVSDVEACIQQVDALGGTVVMPPMDIPGVGRFALIQDPQGAQFYIITYKTA